MCSPLCHKVVFWGFGGFLLIFGGLLSAIWPIIFNQQLRNQLVVSKNSMSFNLWRETPIPMYIDFYLFNWTNPEDTLNKKATPHFVEMGPYVFREEHEKINFNWNENSTVTFKQIRKWTFLPELSKGQLSDEVTNVNVIAMTIGSIIQRTVPKKFFPLIDPIINLEGKLYITKTIKELIFDGYHDIFLDIAKKLKQMGILKENLPMDKFGWFYNRNMSAEYDGVFNMDTGKDSLASLGILRRWNYKEQLDYYPGKCGKVGGTTGELWPINSPSESTATIFATDMCSKIDTDWAGTTDVHGATGSVFSGREHTFDNNTSCYCVGGQCHPSGVREVSTCRYGAPAFISFPHFHLADPVFREMVSGLEPSADKHVFDLTLHKTTGVPLAVNARLQINVLVDQIPGLRFYTKLKRAYMPMIWFNERALITPELASQLSALEIYSWFEPGFLSLTGLGILLIVVGLFIWFSGKWKKLPQLNSPLLEENSS